MQLRMLVTRPIRACALSGLLALLCADSTVIGMWDRVPWPPPWQPASRYVHVTPPDARILFERVDFVLDRAAQTEEAKKKRKAEQHHPAASGAKPDAKAASSAPAASSAAASRTAPGVPSPASRPSVSGGSASATSEAPPAPSSSALASSAAVGTAPAPARRQEEKPGTVAQPGNAASAYPMGQADAPHSGRGRPPRLTRDQLMALMPGATILRENTAGALRQWVDVPDGTLTVYWAGGGLLQSQSASGKWSVSDDGRFCLQIDWKDKPENWCRFLERTPKGAYQPVPDTADENWTPPKDQTDWRPLTIRH